jgi:predicted nucleotidyltransferase component of viral defense system
MITKKQLVEISKTSDLNLYQREKDYLLKLFLHNYYRRYEDAVFKGGTSIRYLYGLDRFSEDLDFNITNTPKEFAAQVDETLRKISILGVESDYLKKETFPGAFTCEITFKGPLHEQPTPTRNKIRIDAGKRTGTLKEPIWQLITSEYPDTPRNFTVLAMDEEELLAEKIAALMERGKGRDLYDTWFLIKKGVKLDKKILKAKTTKKRILKPTKGEYEQDIKHLTNRPIPYEQAMAEVNRILQQI